MASNFPKWTKRGTGRCPVCHAEYSTAWKPKNCSSCGEEIGGTYVPKAKKAKLDNPDCVCLFSGSEEKIYSCKTSPRGDRCFVNVSEAGQFCHYENCKKSRAVTVVSEGLSVDNFSCQHIKMIPNCIKPQEQWFVTDEALEAYPCDVPTKELLNNLTNDQTISGWPHVLQVATNVYVVCGPASASAPLGYVHVIKTKDNYRCTSKDCKSLNSTGAGKQQKLKKLCTHQHVLLSVLPHSSSHLSTTTPTIPSTNQELHVSSSSVTHALSIKANEKPTIPYNIPLVWIDNGKACDAATVLKLEEGGWPVVFAPKDTKCKICQGDLGIPKQHPGSRGRSLILTNMNPFLVCEMKVKVCLNKTCKAMHQAWPIDFGLFNICDKVLLSLEVLLEWRELFKRGVPVSSAIESKLDSWCKVVKKIKYDANEDSSPLPLESFLNNLKDMWSKKIIFANDDDVNDEGINASTVPPLIAPAIRGEQVFNTEMKKKSIYLQSRKKAAQGDPALLHYLIVSKELEMNSLESLNLEQLKEIAKKCNIMVASGASKSFIITEIHCLYASLLVGKSPCHGFNKVPGNTGGFYHFVCRHGATVASKFMFLQESVRDAGDIYLSLRYPPPLFICDTPCGFARHMDLREPHNYFKCVVG